jgi:hypothetical protein
MLIEISQTSTAGFSLGSEASAPEIDDLLSQSRGEDGRAYLSRETHHWLGELKPQLPNRFWIHQDEASRYAARLLGAGAFVRNNRIFLGDVPDQHVESVLRHELVHLAQVQVALSTGRIAPHDSIECEADLLSSLPIASRVQYGASPNQNYPILWFVAIGVGAYVLLRPSVANAPGPDDRTFASPSMGQILGEAFCIFAIPGGALALGGRLGLGFLGSTALAGASGNVGLRAVDDVVKGEASHPLMYVFDATTGAVIGFIVPGGIRLIGKAGTYGLDRLATYGIRNSDIALTNMLAQQAAKAPLNATQAQQILQSRGMGGQVSQWWLNRRGVIVLYRGQDRATSEILSPLARQEGVAASEALVARLRALGLSDSDIATYSARYHIQNLPQSVAPPGMAGLGPGSVGIPTTRLPGIAAGFGDDGVIYVIRVPRGAAIAPRPWQGLHMEDEYIILNQVPPGSIIQAIPAKRVAPLTIDDNSLLAPLH